MTAEFDEVGFKFLYPENWEPVRDEVTEWPRSVSVHSPTGAFWSVTESQSASADQLLNEIVDALVEEYDEVETRTIKREVGDLTLRGVELQFYCLDFLITAQVVVCDQSDRRVVLLFQAENRDFDALANVFDAMSLSLLSNRQRG